MRAGPLERYLRILEVVAASRDGLTLTQLAQAAGLPKATIFRLTRALVDAGALAADDAAAKRFHIGERMRRLSLLGQRPETMDGYFQIVLDDLSADLCETTYVARLEEITVRTVARSVPDQGLRLYVVPGHELPLHAAAASKAILAYQPGSVLSDLVRGPFDGLTAATRTEAADVLEDLENVRSRGYAVCDREIDMDTMAYAAPVRTGGSVVFSIGVTGPYTRVRRHEPSHYVAALLSAAERLQRLLDLSPAPAAHASPGLKTEHSEAPE